MTTSIITLNSADAYRALVIAHRTQDAFAAGLLTASIRALKMEMAKRIVKVTFMKKDGTITTRYATTLPMMTGHYVNGRGLPADVRKVVVFWDCEASGENKWRSFRFEKLISWE